MKYYTSFAIMIVVLAVGYWMIRRGQRGIEPKVRHLAVFDAVDEAIGRATEMGRPVHFSTGFGSGGLNSAAGGMHMAGLSMLDYTARLCASQNTQIIFSAVWPETVPVAATIIRNAFIAVGKLDHYREDSVRFQSSDVLAYNLAANDTIRTEKCAVNIMIGSFYSSDALIIGEAGALAGAIQIGGDVGVGSLCNFIPTCDYVLIGDEMLAAGAYVSKDWGRLSSVVAGDYGKLLVVIIILGSVILNALGVNVISLYI